jgi:hypothetical protein
MSPDDIKTFFSAGAMVVSVISLCATSFFWFQSNRPIVTAFVEEFEDASGNIATIFNLKVSNTGTRPATRVRLVAMAHDVESLVDSGAEERERQSIRACFAGEAEIPLLRNGEELVTAFGSYQNGKPPWLNYGRAIMIAVEYRGIQGLRKYKSRMPLKIYARTGFGGSSWSRAKKE